MASRHLPMATDKPVQKPKKRLPAWFRTKLPTGEQQKIFNDTKASVKDNNCIRFVRKQSVLTYTNAGQVAMQHS